MMHFSQVCHVVWLEHYEPHVVWLECNVLILFAICASVRACMCVHISNIVNLIS